MHVAELVQLAAFVSAQGPNVLAGSHHLSTDGSERYWTAAKCRFDRWGRELKQHLRRAADADIQISLLWFLLRPVLEEILCSESLARVWAALAAAHDRQHNTQELEPVARSVMIGHLEARHRALELMLHGPGLGSEHAVYLNRLRRRIEQWTDLMVAHVAPLSDPAEFALDAGRAARFLAELGPAAGPGATRRWSLALGALQGSRVPGLDVRSPNADLNAAIAAAIASSLPPTLFDDAGLPRSLWLARMYAISDDAQWQLSRLACDDRGAPQQDSPLAGPWRADRPRARGPRFRQ
ncbi:MAG: hypothetical protein AB7U73_10375 [Pirellulales bacterium]